MNYKETMIPKDWAIIENPLDLVVCSIANASGDIFGPKMSDIEEDTIFEITKSFDLSIESLNEKPSVHDILKKITKKLKKYY